MAIAHFGEAVLIERRHIVACQVEGTAGGYVEAPDDVHERALARTRRSDDGNELALVDGQGHVRQRVDLEGATGISLGERTNVDDGAHDPAPTTVGPKPPAPGREITTDSPASRPER